MTYKEFKENVEELGLRCKFYDYGCDVYVVYHKTVIATISKTQPYHGVILVQIVNDIESKLLNLCCELIRTPINERGSINDL